MNNFRICKTCLNRKTDMSGKLYCGFNIDPQSDFKCTEYLHDEMEKIRLEIQKAKANLTAPLGLRFANYILDFIAYYILTFLVGIVFGIILLLTETDPSWLENLSVFSKLFFYFTLKSSYYIFFEAVFGQTLGKMITKTKVVDENGDKPTLERIMTRTLCRFIPFEAFSFLVPNPIGWHDSLSRTRVVMKN
jgi:uncharacterized RDD family membrane protein YckC